MNDILIMWCVLLYQVVGILVAFLITNMVSKNEHKKLNEYADDHAFEVFIMMILWPVYVLMVVVAYTFVILWKWFKTVLFL